MAKDKWRVVKKPALIDEAPKEKVPADIIPASRPESKPVVADLGDGASAQKPTPSKPLKPQKKKIPLKLFFAVVAVPIVVVAILTYVVHLI